MLFENRRIPFEFISLLGDPLFWILVSFIFLYVGFQDVFVILLLFVLINSIVVMVLKFIFRRSRPSGFQKDFRFFGPNQYGFPSGHSALAVGLFLFIIPSMMKSSKIYTCPEMNTYYILALILVGGVFLSRITLKCHDLLDLLGGALVSSFVTVPITYLFLHYFTDIRISNPFISL